MPREAQPPWSGSYLAKVTLVLLALCPNIVVTTGVTLLTPVLVESLHGSTLGVALSSGLSNAGYALGAVAAVALNQKLRPRRLLLSYEALFVLGSLLCALAPDMALFGAGRVAQGLATGLLLVAALPPLVTRFGPERLPTTAAVVNVGLFGAVTVGPLLGGLAARPGAWRIYFLALAGLGAAGLLVQWVSAEHRDPLKPDARTDWVALGLAFVGTVLPFFAVSELVATPIQSGIVLAPLAVGLVGLVALVLVEFHRQEPLMPVRLLRTTMPVAGILGAMAAGAVYVAVLELLQTYLTMVARHPPLQAGLIFWPGIVGIALAALLLRQLFPSRWLLPLLVAGMATIALAGLLVALAGFRPSSWEILLGSFGLGFGAGAAVSPGLFIAALSLPSAQIGTVFAMVELLRSEAAFLVGPVLVYVAVSLGPQGAALARGINIAVWGALALSLAALAAMVGLLVAARVPLRPPDLRAWVESGEAPALDSPALAEGLRG